MKRPIALASADWHLDRAAWVRHPTLSGDAYYGLAQLVDICCDNDVPLIGAGDLFDKTHPDPKSVYEAMRQIDRLEKERLHLYYIQGQHERSYDQPWLSLSNWPTHIHDKRCFSLNGVTCSGLDWTRASEVKGKLNEVCNHDGLLICHQVWSNLMSMFGAKTECSFSDVPNVRLMLTGDYHKHVIRKSKGKSGQELTVLSPGSLCLQSLDEPVEKACFLIYDDLSFDSIKLKSRHAHMHEIYSEHELNAFLNTIDLGWLEPDVELPEELSKPIVSIKYDASLSNLFTTVTDLLEQRCHLFLKPISKTEDIDSEEVLASEASKVIELGLEGNLSKLCQKNSPEYNVCLRLLRASNIAEELKHAEIEYLAAAKNSTLLQTQKL